MLSKTLQVFITSIAFAPVLLVLWIINLLPIFSIYHFGTTDFNLQGIKGAFYNAWLFTGWYFWVFVVLILAADRVIDLVRKRLAIRPLEIKSIKSSDINLNMPLVSYFLPLVKLQVTELSSAYFWAILVVFFVFALNNRRTYHYNPVLTLFFGLRHYEVATKKEVTYILITKKTLINADQCRNYIAVTEYLIIDAE